MTHIKTPHSYSTQSAFAHVRYVFLFLLFFFVAVGACLRFGNGYAAAAGDSISAKPVGNATSSQIEVVWSAAASGSYHIKVTEQSVPPLQYYDYQVNGGFSGVHTFTGLKPNASYIVSLVEDNNPTKADTAVSKVLTNPSTTVNPSNPLGVGTCSAADPSGCNQVDCTRYGHSWSPPPLVNKCVAKTTASPVSGTSPGCTSDQNCAGQDHCNDSDASGCTNEADCKSHGGIASTVNSGPGGMNTTFVCTTKSKQDEKSVGVCGKGGSFFGFPTWYKYLKMNGNCEPVFCLLGNNELAGDGKTKCEQSSVPLVVLAIIEILLRLGSLVAVAFVITGGIKFVTSQGEPDGVRSARTTIVNALIGLVITIIATPLISFIAKSLGAG